MRLSLPLLPLLAGLALPGLAGARAKHKPTPDEFQNKAGDNPLQRNFAKPWWERGDQAEASPAQAKQPAAAKAAPSKQKASKASKKGRKGKSIAVSPY